MDLNGVAENICSEFNYNLISPVGSGAFKITYLVADNNNNKFALKLFFEGSAIERQEREVDALVKCNHINIAKLHRVDSIIINEKKIPWLLEEYLEGGTLTELLDKGSVNEKKIKDLGLALLNAVKYLSEVKLVHRDIKPDNIMFRHDGTPVLVDFGLVRDLSSPSLTKTFLQMGPGTPLYASPEQLNNEKLHIDWRTDQFCIGVVLTYALFGIHPYQHENEALQLTIERVAQRGERSISFIRSVRGTKFSALETMTEPWQIRRYRSPRLVIDAWEKG